jgi:hypothetical protein
MFKHCVQSKRILAQQAKLLLIKGVPFLLLFVAFKWFDEISSVCSAMGAS